MGKVENLEELAFEFGCKVGTLPLSYLGLPLGAPFKYVAVWDGIEERFHKKLVMWKKQYLSKGGRIALIWSTLSSMLIYFMPLFCITRIVEMKLEHIQRDFL